MPHLRHTREKLRKLRKKIMKEFCKAAKRCEFRDRRTNECTNNKNLFLSAGQKICSIEYCPKLTVAINVNTIQI